MRCEQTFVEDFELDLSKDATTIPSWIRSQAELWMCEAFECKTTSNRNHYNLRNELEYGYISIPFLKDHFEPFV